MATFNALIFKHHKKADGTFNIKIQVTHNRETKYIPTTYFVEKSDITKSFRLKNQFYIDQTDELCRKYRKKCDLLGEKLNYTSIDELIQYLKKEESTEEEEKFDLDVIAYGNKIIQDLISTGHEGNARVYKNAIDNLIKFIGKESLSIHEITSSFVVNWKTWIETQPAPSNKKKGNRGPSLYLATMRAIHNSAKKEFNDEDAGIINIPLSPFKNKVPQPPATKKRAISAEQIQKIVAIEYNLILQPGFNRFNLAKDVFLLSFGLIGMNAVDLYNCDDIKDGRITYNRTKTKNRREDQAEMSVRIEPEILPLVEKYRDHSGKRVFNFYHHYSSVNAFSTALNKGLKNIGKIIGVEDLEFYSARHTWATIATNDAEVDKLMVHTALNHVDQEMKVTDIYVRKSWDPIDKANRKVLDFVKLKIGDIVEPKKGKPESGTGETKSDHLLQPITPI
jgi:integrase